MTSKLERAVLAGGCFWGMQDLIRKLPGVVHTRVGYTGGDVRHATYRNHGSHAEAIEIEFDPQRVSYDDLLEVFWETHDPTRLDRRRPDVGTQYRSAIFVHSPEQMAAARASKERAQAHFSKPIVTEIEPASEFYRAEESHQRYADKRQSGSLAR